MRRRVIYNLLTVTALLAALGTDYLAQAGTHVRAEAVVSVAEKMAARFSRAFPQRSSQPATHLETTRHTAVIVRDFPATGRQDPQQARYCSMHTLHLPPPLA